MTIYLNVEQQAEYARRPGETVPDWSNRVIRLYREHAGWKTPGANQLYPVLAGNGNEFPNETDELWCPNSEYISATDSDAGIPPFHLEWGADEESDDFDDTGERVVHKDETYTDIPFLGRVFKYYATLETAEDTASRLANIYQRSIVVANAVNGWTMSVGFDYDDYEE